MTAARDEHRLEAEGRFKSLRAALAAVPADILREACRRYVQANTFFPSAAADLLRLTNAIIWNRERTASRLARIARCAEQDEAERKRLADDPLTPEGVAAIKAEFGLGRPVAEKPRPTDVRAAPAVATVDQYIALGLTDEEARQAVADHARLLSRSRATSVGAAAGRALSGAEAAAA